MPSFDAKTMGRKFYVLLTTLVVVVSCGLEEIGGDSNSKDDIWLGPGSIIGGGTESGVGQKVWYAVGVDYPDRYDWREDEECESVKCSLVVFANGIPMMKVPVGKEYEVNSDPDTHRMIGRDLYTDYSTDDETVIKRNGVQLFRYAGRERIIDMKERNGDIYTLGQARDGSGFSFRCNGEEIVCRKSGYLFTGFQQCEDGFDFAFCEQIGTGTEVVERYYCYCSGEIYQIALREDIKKVWDIMMWEGNVSYIASLVGISSPVLFHGADMDILEITSSFKAMSCRFVSSGENPKIEVMMTQKGKTSYVALWDGANKTVAFPAGYTVASIYDGDNSVSCVLNAPDATSEGIIYRCGESMKMPEGYMSLGGSSMEMVDGMLYVGLTSRDGGNAAVWVDNEMKPLKINGFISYVSSN